MAFSTNKNANSAGSKIYKGQGGLAFMRVSGLT